MYAHATADSSAQATESPQQQPGSQQPDQQQQRQKRQQGPRPQQKQQWQQQQQQPRKPVERRTLSVSSGSDLGKTAQLLIHQLEAFGAAELWCTGVASQVGAVCCRMGPRAGA
jgi:hypothetical protein